jgi:hypothetical protein
MGPIRIFARLATSFAGVVVEKVPYELTLKPLRTLTDRPRAFRTAE